MNRGRNAAEVADSYSTAGFKVNFDGYLKK